MGSKQMQYNKKKRGIIWSQTIICVNNNIILVITHFNCGILQPHFLEILHNVLDVVKKTLMERKEFCKTAETFMTDCALTMVTPKVLVTLFLFFYGQNSALQLLERGLWAEFILLSQSPSGRLSYTQKMCFHTVIAQKTPCCGLDLRKSGRMEQKGLMNAQCPLGRAVIQSCALWNRVQAFSHSLQIYQCGLVRLKLWSCMCVWIYAGCHLQKQWQWCHLQHLFTRQLCCDMDVQRSTPISNHILSRQC